MKENSPSFTAASVANGVYKVSRKHPELVDQDAAAMSKMFMDAYRKNHWFEEPKALVSLLPPSLTFPIMDSYNLGLTQHYVGRKNAIEAVVQEQTAEKGIEQIVILGAGFDTFALRDSRKSPYVKYIETDHPATQGLKVKVATSKKFKDHFGETPANLTFAPLDLTKTDLITALEQGGYNPAKKTVFVMEGLMPYLDKETYQSTLATLQEHSSKGSLFVVSFMGNNDLSEGGKKRFEKVKKELMDKGEGYKWDANAQDMVSDGLKSGLALISTSPYHAMQNEFSDAERIKQLAGEKGEAYVLFENLGRAETFSTQSHPEYKGPIEKGLEPVKSFSQAEPPIVSYTEKELASLQQTKSQPSIGK